MCSNFKGSLLFFNKSTQIQVGLFISNIFRVLLHSKKQIKTMVFIFIYLILYFCIPLCFGLDLGCRDLKGKPVDWFVAYKLPDLPTTKKGSQFLYMDPKTPTWRQSDLPITDPKSAIGKTFAQLWEAKKNSEVLYAVYNDDDPGTNRTDSYRAHMKGAMAFDDFTGFWVIHSVPRFIDLSKRLYSYPDSGLKYGQIFFCATYSVTALLEIGKHLEFSQPSTTQFRIPPSFSKLFPALSRALERKRLSSKAGDYTISQNIETLAGVKLKIFAKNRKFEKDLYSNFVASELNTPFLVESWLNGAASDLPSNCNGIGKVYPFLKEDINN